jgi:hypothetical protein
MRPFVIERTPRSIGLQDSTSESEKMAFCDEFVHLPALAGCQRMK